MQLQRRRCHLQQLHQQAKEGRIDQGVCHLCLPTDSLTVAQKGDLRGKQSRSLLCGLTQWGHVLSELD